MFAHLLLLILSGIAHIGLVAIVYALWQLALYLYSCRKAVPFNNDIIQYATRNGYNLLATGSSEVAFCRRPWYELYATVQANWNVRSRIRNTNKVNENATGRFLRLLRASKAAMLSPCVADALVRRKGDRALLRDTVKGAYWQRSMVQRQFNGAIHGAGSAYLPPRRFRDQRGRSDTSAGCTEPACDYLHCACVVPKSAQRNSLETDHEQSVGGGEKTHLMCATACETAHHLLALLCTSRYFHACQLPALDVNLSRNRFFAGE